MCSEGCAHFISKLKNLLELLEIAQTMPLMPFPPSALHFLPILDVWFTAQYISFLPKVFPDWLFSDLSSTLLLWHSPLWHYNLVIYGYAWFHLLGTKFSRKMRAVPDLSLHPSQNLKQGHSAKISWMNQSIYLHSERRLWACWFHKLLRSLRLINILVPTKVLVNFISELLLLNLLQSILPCLYLRIFVCFKVLL